MSRRRPLFLIGFMASGKTTLGRALAERLPGSRFIDLDEAIEKREEASVAEIFKRHGEAYFRACEAEVLREAAQEGAIVACGGGTPCQSANMDFMLAQGTVVWLVADDDVTERRLRLARGQRPLVDALLDDPDALRRHIADLTSRRRPAYSRAHFTFDSNELEDEAQIEASCRRFLMSAKLS